MQATVYLVTVESTGFRDLGSPPSKAVRPSADMVSFRHKGAWVDKA